MTITSNQSTFAVVIPHYNDAIRLRRCLDALVPQLDDVTQIIVVDNASTEPYDDVARDFPNVRFVTETEKGAGPTRNRGVAETDADFVMFLDSDCLPASNWLSQGQKIAQAGHVIGGRVDVFAETPAPMSGAEAFEMVFAFKMESYLQEKGFLGSGNLLVARTDFIAVGGFRAAVSEDVEWSQRAARSGLKLGYDNDWVASHPARVDWPALRHKWRRLAYEGYGLRVVDFRSRLVWVARALAMLPSAIAHTPRVLRAPDLSISDKMRALWTLFRLRLCRMGWMLRQVATGNP